MPDLTPIYFRVCESNFEWEREVEGSKGNKYTVSFGQSSERYEVDWHCTCDAFRFGKGKHCKHIEACKELKCDWNHDAFMGSGEEWHEDKCPKCGGDTRVVKVMV